jgi:hypothetical protein
MFRRRLLAMTAVTALAVLGLVAPAHAVAGPLADCLTLPAPTCYAPSQFLTAYGICDMVGERVRLVPVLADLGYGASG